MTVIIWSVCSGDEDRDSRVKVIHLSRNVQAVVHVQMNGILNICQQLQCHKVDESSETEVFQSDKVWLRKIANIMRSSREPTDFRVPNNSLFAGLQLCFVKTWNL